MREAEDVSRKVVLCYGDSNTWGYVPAGGGARFPAHVRWPGVLSGLLRQHYLVIEEGLCGRTTAFDDPLAPPGVERNGLRTLGAVMDSHKPIDLAVFFLGVNDLKKRFSLPPVDIACGVERLAGMASNPVFGPAGSGRAPDVLVICPPSIWEVAANLGPQFEGGREKSQELHRVFHDMAGNAGLPLLYAGDCIGVDPSDGIHLSADSHGILGREVAKWIREWFNDE